MRLCSSLLSLVATMAVVIAAPLYDNSSALVDKLVSHPTDKIVPGEYLVTVEPNTNLDVHTAKVSNLLDSASESRLLRTVVVGTFKSYHIHTTDSQVLQSIAAMEEVTMIEPNLIITGAVCSSHDTNNWGLTRINFNRVPNYATDQRYHYDSDGRGATIYLLDSGIKKSLPHFWSATIYFGRDFIDERGPGQQMDTDEHGHGTGLAAALVTPCCGIAKQATLIDVRILNENNDGSVAILTQALQYVHQSQGGTRPWPNQPAVVNLSVQADSFSSTLDAVMQQLRNAGITMVTGSGNRRANACAYSPGGSRYAISVAATDRNDRFWYPSNSTVGSNYGKCVDILAPGVEINLPALQLMTFQIATGTSISAALVTGSVARLISEGIPATPAILKHELLQRAISTTVTNLQPKTTNKMLYMECV